MKKIKKPMILLLSTMLFLMTNASVFATDNNVTELSDDIYLQKMEKMFNKVSLEELNNSSDKNQFTNMIENLSNEQFDKFISDLVNTENGISDFREKLNMVGVEITDINKEGFIETRGVTSNNANLSAYIAKRGSDRFYRIYSYNSLKTKETLPGSEDVIEIHFDPSVATFYSYNVVGKYVNLKYQHQSGNGTLVFNYVDEEADTSTQTCAVYVMPKSGTSGKSLKCSVGWTHTFTKLNVSGGGEAEVSFGGKDSTTGSVGVNIKIRTSESSWYRSDVNSTTIV